MVLALHASAQREPRLASYGKPPLVFEPNVGQTSHAARFLTRGAGYVLYLTDRGAILTLRSQKGRPPAVVRMKLEGARRPASLEGAAPTGGVASYFRGRDPTRWRTGIPQFARIEYKRIYPGVDLVYYGQQGELEFDFVLAPGADPGVIELTWEGVHSLRLDEAGDLVLATPAGTLRQRRPRVYQPVDGRRNEIEGHYVLRGARKVGFALARYDATRPLVIDPILSYSTFLGGSGDDFATHVAVDSAGNAYVTGQTSSLDFPATAGALDSTSNGGDDVFVTKLNPAGTAVLYSTYLGGSGSDWGAGIAVDSAGNAYITGSTDSPNFPTTAGAFDTSPNGGHDGFVAKLNATGTALVYSTLLGGSGHDASLAIAVDSGGSATVAGATLSLGFPTTAGAYDTSHNGGSDVFVTRLNAAGSGLVYATLLGGSGDEAASDLALDSTGNAYLTGYTSSSNFPATAGSYDSSHNGGSFPSDVFVVKLNPTGSALVYSTFLGSSGDEWGYRIRVDTAGNAYVAGQTWSGSFPTTAGAFDTSFNGLVDVFVSKLNSTGTALVYSTFLGGSDQDAAFGLAVDSAGRVCLAGRTVSADFPATAGAIDPSFNGLSDAFLARLDAGGAGLLYSSFLGGSGYDSATSLALDAAGNAVLTGFTFPVDFPTTAGAYDVAWNGGFDAFVAKVSFGPVVESVTPSAGSGSSQTFSFVYSHPDGYAALPWAQVVINSTLSQLNACYLHYNRQASQVSLLNDAGTVWLGPLTLGTSDVLSNSQCTVTASGSSASGSGATLTLNLALSFHAAFAGAKTIYMQTQDTAGASTGWQAKGAWTVP